MFLAASVYLRFCPNWTHALCWDDVCGVSRHLWKKGAFHLGTHSHKNVNRSLRPRNHLYPFHSNIVNHSFLSHVWNQVITGLQTLSKTVNSLEWLLADGSTPLAYIYTYRHAPNARIKMILLEVGMWDLAGLLPKVPLIVLHADLNALGEVAGLRNGSEKVSLNQTQVIQLWSGGCAGLWAPGIQKYLQKQDGLQAVALVGKK